MESPLTTPTVTPSATTIALWSGPSTISPPPCAGTTHPRLHEWSPATSHCCRTGTRVPGSRPVAQQSQVENSLPQINLPRPQSTLHPETRGEHLSPSSFKPILHPNGIFMTVICQFAVVQLLVFAKNCIWQFLFLFSCWSHFNLPVFPYQRMLQINYRHIIRSDSPLRAGW